MQNKLEVNRDLINTDFQAYRYNREAKYTCQSEPFPAGHKLHTFKLGNSDYSYGHASMSSSINNLYTSQFDPATVYFVSDFGTILGSSLVHAADGSVKFEMKPLFTIPCKVLS